MPKSRRDKSVFLGRTQPATVANKQSLVANVQQAVREFNSIYVYTVANMRNTQLKAVRHIWSDSRFFMGKTKIMQFGLGKTPETESAPGLHKLAKLVDTQCGLLFTDRPSTEVLPWFREFKEDDYARAGNIATKTVNLLAGPMPNFSYAMEHHMRSLGLPTRLNCSAVCLTTDYTVCNRGDILTVEQTKILKLVGIKLATFRVTVKCFWKKSSGEVVYPPAEVYEPEPDIVQPVETTPVFPRTKSSHVYPEDSGNARAPPSSAIGFPEGVGQNILRPMLSPNQMVEMGDDDDAADMFEL